MKKKKYIILLGMLIFLIINNISFAGDFGSSAENDKYYMTMERYKKNKFPNYVSVEGIDFLKSDMYPGGMKYHPWIIGQNIEGFNDTRCFI